MTKKKQSPCHGYHERVLTLCSDFFRRFNRCVEEYLIKLSCFDFPHVYEIARLLVLLTSSWPSSRISSFFPALLARWKGTFLEDRGFVKVALLHAGDIPRRRARFTLLPQPYDLPFALFISLIVGIRFRWRCRRSRLRMHHISWTHCNGMNPGISGVADPRTKRSPVQSPLSFKCAALCLGLQGCNFHF